MNMPQNCGLDQQLWCANYRWLLRNRSGTYPDTERSSAATFAGIISPTLNKIKPLNKLSTYQRIKLLMDFRSVMNESMDRVATITLNRPERFNAISETMPDDIASAFNQAVSERDARDPIRGSRN